VGYKYSWDPASRLLSKFSSVPFVELCALFVVRFWVLLRPRRAMEKASDMVLCVQAIWVVATTAREQ